MHNLIRLTIFIFCFMPFIIRAEDAKLKGSVVTLSEQSSAEVTADTIVANLEFASQEEDSVKLQSAINKTMEKAIKIIKDYRDIELTSQRYSVYQTYDSRKTN
ncbi:MAG: hypothetical protein DGJ47_000765, partial [Rickettsiaceae bacterium]